MDFIDQVTRVNILAKTVLTDQYVSSHSELHCTRQQHDTGQRHSKKITFPYLQSAFNLYKIPLFEQPEVDILCPVLKSFPKIYAELLHVDILKNTR